MRRIFKKQIILLALILVLPSWALANYYVSVAHGNWNDPNIWGIVDETADPDTVIPPPHNPPSGGDVVIATNVYITEDRGWGPGNLTMPYWAGGLYVQAGKSFSNYGIIHFWSRCVIETADNSAKVDNQGTIHMYPEGGYGAIISANIENHGVIHAHTGAGGGSILYSLVLSQNELIVDPGAELYVGVGDFDGNLRGDIVADGNFHYTQSGGRTTEFLAATHGTGQISLGGRISFPVNIGITNPLIFSAIKLGSGTLSSYGPLTLGGAVSEGTLEIHGPCGFVGLSIGSSAIVINYGSLYQGYGVPHGSGVFRNNGTYIWDYDYNQYCDVNFENRGTFIKRGSAGAIFTGPFEHCVDSAFYIHVETPGWLQLWNPVPCTTPTNSLTSIGGTIRVDSGAAFIVPGFDFSGDTVDNRGTITSNPFRFVRSDPPQVLTGGGTITNLDVSGGNVHLLGPQLIGNFTLSSGKLYLDDVDLNLGSGSLSGADSGNYIVTNGTGRLIRDVGTSFVDFPVGTNTSFNPVSVKTESGAESFSVGIAGEITPSVGNPALGVQRSWNISEGTPGGNGQITFTAQWNDGEEGSSFDRDAAEGWRNSGGSWVRRVGSLTSITPGTTYPAMATITTDSLSAWAVANETTSPTLSTNVLPLDSVGVSLSKTDSIWVHNTGWETVSIDSTLSSSERFEITPVSTSIAPSDSASFHVTFSPISLGLQTSDLLFYSSVSTTPETLQASGVGTTTVVSVGFDSGWTLISNPVTRDPGTDSVLQLFPASSLSLAFAFNSLTGYETHSILERGRGYWEKFAAGGTSNIGGLPQVLDTMDVHSGWNLVGSFAFTTDTADIVSDPPGLRMTPWYAYSGGYSDAEYLVPGKGYWVKATTTGRFIFNGLLSSPPSSSNFVREYNPPGDEITLSDMSGAKQSLFIEARQTERGLQSELPPPGPEGTFDARFESQRSIESINENGGKEIVIRSSHYPVTFCWNTHDRSYTLRDGVTGMLFPPRTISGKGELTITNPAVNRLLLTPEDAVPHEFALSQNYPNPFNPTTEIKFSVEKPARTTLEVFNVLGQRVTTLFNENAEPGRYYTVKMDGLNMASGVYFYTLRSGARVDTRKMLLLK